MKYTIYFLLILAVTQSQTQSGSIEVQDFQQSSTHGIFIFLDDTEEDLGAATIGFLNAFVDQAGPILFSGSIINNILEQPNLEELIKQSKTDQERIALQTIQYYVKTAKKILEDSPTPTTLQDKQKLLQQLNTSLPYTWPLYNSLISVQANPNLKKIRMAILKEVLDLSPTYWLLKKVNDFLYLLIPKEYINNMQKKHGQKFQKTTQFSQAELALGLKIDHLKDVADDWVAYFSKQYKRPTEFPVNYFSSYLPSVFITRAEYTEVIRQNEPKEDKKEFKIYYIEAMPKWFIYLLGHGSPKKVVGGLSPNGFIELLEFLEKKIVTKLFAYISCYSSGINMHLIFKDLKSNLYKNFSYAIALAGLSEASVTESIPTDKLFDVPLHSYKDENIDFNQKKLKISVPFEYKYTLETVQSPSFVYEDIYLDFPRRSSTDLVHTGIQLKLPGMFGFRVIDGWEQHFVSINNVLAQTRKQPLDIKKYFNIKKGDRDPEGILLYTSKIPFDLIIDTKEMPQFIPMTLATAFELNKLTSKTLNVNQIISAFLGLKDLGTIKVFLIKKIQDAQNTTIENVMIKVGEDKMLVTYLQNGKFVTLNEQLKPVEMDQEKAKKLGKNYIEVFWDPVVELISAETAINQQKSKEYSAIEQTLQKKRIEQLRRQASERANAPKDLPKPIDASATIK